ncbi:unnamed protein product [Effrenium voratum]|nr:unnamed protein product [Effrenium voratum]
MLGCLRVIRNHAECPAGRTSGKDPHDLCRYCFPQFILMFGLTMPVALLGALADDPLLGLDNSSLNSVLALGTLARAVGKLFNGVLLDHFGVRPFLFVVLLLASGACCALAVAQSIGMVGLAVVVLSYCSSGSWLSGCKLIERRFKEDSSLCFSVLATCSRLSAVLTRLALGLVLLLLPWRRIAELSALVMLGAWALVQALLKTDHEKDADGKPKLQVEPATPRDKEEVQREVCSASSGIRPVLCNRGLQLHAVAVVGATCLMSMENLGPLLLKDLANLSNAEASMHAAIFPAGVMLGVFTLPHFHVRIASPTGRLLFELGLQSLILVAGGFLLVLVSLPPKTVRVEFILSCLACIALGVSFNYYIKPGLHIVEFGDRCATASSMLDAAGLGGAVAFQCLLSVVFRCGGSWPGVAAALIGSVLVLSMGTVLFFLERSAGAFKCRQLRDLLCMKAFRAGLLLLGGSAVVLLALQQGMLPQDGASANDVSRFIAAGK